MKHLKLTALVLSALTAMPLFGCSPDLLLPDSAADPSAEITAERYDVNALKKRVEELRDTWTYQDKEDEINAEIEALMREIDKAYALNVRAEMAYYADWKNDALKSYYEKTNEDYYVAFDMVTWAFDNGYQNSMYREQFEPYADLVNLEYFTLNPLSRIMGYARQDAASSTEQLDEYYDAAYSEDLSIAETNRSCAEIYLEILKGYDVTSALYDYYDRDYTAEQVSAMYEDILETLVPAEKELEDRLNLMEPDYGSTYQADALELLKKYAPQISPEIGASAEKFLGEELYVIARGSDCYDGSYTVGLPEEQSAMIYAYMDGTFYDLVTITHEFGHFHAKWRDTLPIYQQTNNLDIAESQSQGMEMLFTSFYPEMLGESATYYEMVEIYNLLDSIVSGFAIGAFEIAVMNQIDTITPEEIVDLFYEIADESNLGRDFYQITHLFEQPGYYVSYGVSALPALQLYLILQEDPEEAKAVYSKLSAVSSVEPGISFASSMQECGFSDFFAKGELDALLTQISEQLDILESKTA